MRSAFNRGARFATVSALLLAGAFLWSPTATLAQESGAAMSGLGSLQAVKRLAPNDQLGTTVAMSGNIAAIGAVGTKNSTGAIYVYARSGKSFKQQAAIADPGGHTLDIFGWSIALDTSEATPSTMVTGTTNADNDLGVVYVYMRAGTTWRLQATLVDPDTTWTYPEFGNSVAIHGNTLLVGAPDDGPNGYGVVYVYNRSGTKWRRTQTIPDPLRKTDDYFGQALSIAGNTAVIGANNWEHSPHQGAAYIYAETRGIWHFQQRLANPGSATNGFGYSVAIYGTTAAIGAFSQGTGGAMYVFTKSRSAWVRRATFSDPKHNRLDSFGFAIAIWGSRIVAGAPIVLGGSPVPAKDCPRAYEYLYSAGKWKQRSTIIDPGCASNDGFGTSIALWQTTALFGAPSANNAAGVVYYLTVP